MAAPTPRPAALNYSPADPAAATHPATASTPPAFERAAPEPPGWLDTEGRAEWRLEPLDMLKQADAALLAARCEAWSRFVRAVRQYRAEGTTIVNPDSGNVRRHPAVGIAEGGRRADARARRRVRAVAGRRTAAAHGAARQRRRPVRRVKAQDSRPSRPIRLTPGRSCAAGVATGPV